MIPIRDNLSCKTFPLATLILLALNCVAFAIELMLPESAVEGFFMTYAVVPAKVSAAFASGDPTLIGMAILSIFTAMFLHGGWMHLIGNMVFLQAFGRAVEARLGSVKFVLFYLLGGFAAWGLHMFTDPMSPIPALGASGAIAAVLGGYLLFYPKAEFKAVAFAGLPLLVVVRAYWLLPVWFLTQLNDGITNLSATGGGVAYWAHIGGFLAGMILAGLWHMYRPQSSVCYVPISCECNCAGGHEHCTKNHKHKLSFLGFGKKHNHDHHSH